MLAHYLARYDGGRYAKLLLEDDIHQINADKIGIELTDDGFNARIMVGANQSSGFANLADAQDALTYYKDKLGGDIKFEVWIKDLETGTYSKFSESSDTMLPRSIAEQQQGEYLVSFNMHERLGVDSAGEVSFIKENSTLHKLAPWIHKAAWAQEWLSRAGNVMVDNRALIEADLARIMRPMYSLREKNRDRVLAVLRDGEVDEKIYEIGELNDKFIAMGAKPHELPKLQAAYISVQQHQRLSYE